MLTSWKQRWLAGWQKVIDCLDDAGCMPEEDDDHQDPRPPDAACWCGIGSQSPSAPPAVRSNVQCLRCRRYLPVSLQTSQYPPKRGLAGR